MTIGDEVSAPETPAAASLSPSPIAPPTATRTRRRRRPSGAPPPLPKHIGTTGTGWLVAFVVLLLWAVLAHNFVAVGRVTDRFDSAILRQVARVRTGWLTNVADAVASGFSLWLATLALLALMVLLMVFKRWRHLFILLGCMFLLQVIGQTMWRNFIARAAVRRHDNWSLGWLVLPGAGDRVRRPLRDRVRVLDGGARTSAHDRQVRRCCGRCCRGGRRVVPRDVRSVRHRDGHRLAGRSRRERLSLLHAERGVPGHLPRRQDRAPRRRRRAGRGHATGGARPARAHGDRDEASRSRGVGRVDAVATAGGGRSRHATCSGSSTR